MVEQTAIQLSASQKLPAMHSHIATALRSFPLCTTTMNILRSVLVFALFQVYYILITFFCNKILIFAQIFQMLFKHVLLCNHTMRRLQDCSMSLLVMTGYVVNKALLFLQFHLLPLRHVNTFFVKIREYTAAASTNGQGTPDYEAFAQEWNQTADGKERYYVTTEVLSAYAKTWEKFNNIHASQEMASDNMDLACQSGDIFAAPHIPFPEFLTSTAVFIQPWQGVIDMDPTQQVPQSIMVLYFKQYNHHKYLR
jgi:hypothetical protein